MPELCGPRKTPVSSTSPSGNAAAGTTSSTRGSGERLRSGLEVMGHINPLNPYAHQRRYTQSIQARGHVVENNAPASGQPFQPPHRKRLGDVEQAKENQRDQAMTPIGGLPSSAIHWPATSSMTTKPGSCASAFALHNGGRGDCRARSRARCRWPAPATMPVVREMQPPGCGGPQQHRRNRAPGAGAGLAVASAEERRDGPGPQCVFPAWFWTRSLRRGISALIRASAVRLAGLARPDLPAPRDREPAS